MKIKENPETESSSESLIDENQRQILGRDSLQQVVFPQLTGSSET